MFDPRNINWPLEVAVRPVADTDPAQLDGLIEKLSAVHPRFAAIRDGDSTTIHISGSDELQLVETLALLRDKLHCDLDVGAPQVAYRESIGETAEVDFVYRKQPADVGEFARVNLIIEPLLDSYDLVFENKAGGSVIPEKYMPGIQKGLQTVLDAGVIAGYPMIGLKVNLVDGAHLDSDSSVTAFERASIAALREAITKAHPILLEPILEIELVMPEESVNSLTQDLNHRRGIILGMEHRENAVTIKAIAPVSTMFGFSNTAKHLTQDRVSFSTRFSRYERVPVSPNDNPPPGEPASAVLRA